MQLENSGDATGVAVNNSTYDVLAGVIIGAHGVQGAVKIKIATSTALSLIRPAKTTAKSSTPVWLGRLPYQEPVATEEDAPAAGQIYQIKQVKELQPGGRVLLLKIQGVTDRNEAEALIGQNVYAPKERRAPLADGEYFTEDLIGLDVVSESGRQFGKVAAVLQQPGNDVYETDKGALIPAVSEFVKSVDIAAKRITVADILGLFQTEADELLGDASDHLPSVASDDDAEEVE
jgi:16S rRNA processing protein RimM